MSLTSIVGQYRDILVDNVLDMKIFADRLNPAPEEEAAVETLSQGINDLTDLLLTSSGYARQRFMEKKMEQAETEARQPMSMEARQPMSMEARQPMDMPTPEELVFYSIGSEPPASEEPVFYSAEPALAPAEPALAPAEPALAPAEPAAPAPSVGLLAVLSIGLVLTLVVVVGAGWQLAVRVDAYAVSMLTLALLVLVVIATGLGLRGRGKLAIHLVALILLAIVLGLGVYQTIKTPQAPHILAVVAAALAFLTILGGLFGALTGRV